MKANNSSLAFDLSYWWINPFTCVGFVNNKDNERD